MNATETYEKLKAVLKSDEAFDFYDERKKAAEWNYSMLTGEHQDEYILQYKDKEDKGMQEQRMRVYNSLTPYVSKKVMNTYDLVEQADNYHENITGLDGESKSSQAFMEDLESINGVGLKKYCYQAMKRLTFYDPNSFLILRENEGHYYIDELYSKDVLKYEYKKNQLEWIVFMIGEKIAIYSMSYWVILEPLDEEKEKDLPKGSEIYEVEEGDHTGRFLVQKGAFKFFTSCPAIEIGYIYDDRTTWETFASPLQSARPLFEDLMKDKSEYDLAKAIHTFLKKYAYVPYCENQEVIENNTSFCEGGTMSHDGSECPSCKGTGMQIHFTQQDVLLFKIRNLSEAIPLQNLVYYEKIPMEIVEAYKKDISEWEQKIIEMIFNSDSFNKSEIAKTATAEILDIQGVHSKFIEYSNKLSQVYKFFVQKLAEANNLKDIQHSFGFNNDFRIESIDDLLMLRQKAVTSGVPLHVIRLIDSKILLKMSQGDSDLVKQIEAREQWRPYRFRTADDKALILSTLEPTSKEYILFVNYDSIVELAETLAMEKAAKIPFHLLKKAEQKTLIEEATNAIN